MNLKKIRAQRAEDRRHRQLMHAAQHVISRRALDSDIAQATPAEVVALAFGRHALRIEDTEALDYLNAVLAERGYPLLTANATASETSE
ncbi:hypothetical protein ABT063_15680 [Streptomyces sp. NPDC002838]|uniref:hypothetical protein n=1 Tax=Streptomyces sp. NPDC002838 TaxID=3154436 RepID=UPI003330E590